MTEYDEYKTETFYEYQALQHVETTFDMSMDHENVPVMCLLYKVNTGGKEPFLEFILEKDKRTRSVYDTPEMLHFVKGFKNQSVSIDSFLTSTLASFLKEYEGLLTWEKKGWFLYKDSIVVVVECKEETISNKLIARRDKAWFLLVHEIMEERESCYMPIDNDVFDFFLQGGMSFLFLHDAKGNIYETPRVGYVGRTIPWLSFTYTFRVPRTLGIWGSQYYFTDSKTALDKMKKDAIENRGIVKCAVFLGNSKYMQYNVDIDDGHDMTDECYETFSREDIEQELKGCWSDVYDSIMFERNDNEFSLVVKGYNQCVPVCYHAIDKRSFSEAVLQKDHNYVNFMVA